MLLVGSRPASYRSSNSPGSAVARFYSMADGPGGRGCNLASGWAVSPQNIPWSARGAASLWASLPLPYGRRDQKYWWCHPFTTFKNCFKSTLFKTITTPKLSKTASNQPFSKLSLLVAGRFFIFKGWMPMAPFPPVGGVSGIRFDSLDRVPLAPFFPPVGGAIGIQSGFL